MFLFSKQWGTVVNRYGQVCEVVFTGDALGDQWPGSRAISAQKAYTANAFSLNGLSLTTANLFSLTQDEASLFGLQFSNPVDPSVAYGGRPSNFGTEADPMRCEIMGGINVFGGGIALYNSDGSILGGLGVSGDSSCADAMIVWKTRQGLGLDYPPNCDQFDVNTHSDCGNSDLQSVVDDANADFPVSSPWITNSTLCGIIP